MFTNGITYTTCYQQFSVKHQSAYTLKKLSNLWELQVYKS